jgi:hypothetical protein
MLIATHEVVAKKTFEFNLGKKKKKLAYPNTSNYGAKCDE